MTLKEIEFSSNPLTFCNLMLNCNRNWDILRIKPRKRTKEEYFELITRAYKTNITQVLELEE